MNRRSLLKTLAALPFFGALVRNEDEVPDVVYDWSDSEPISFITGTYDDRAPAMIGPGQEFETISDWLD